MSFHYEDYSIKHIRDGVQYSFNMQEGEPGQTGFPLRIGHNLLTYVDKAVPRISREYPPTALLDQSGIILAHYVEMETPERTAYLASLVGYVGLGAEPYLVLQTLARTQKGDEPLKLVIPDRNQGIATVQALHPKLGNLKKSITLAPFTTLPVWVALDALPLTLQTPPGLETVAGTIGMLLLSQLIWSRHVRRVARKLHCGDVEFTEKPELSAAQEALLSGDCDRALDELSEANGLFSAEMLNVAEMVILSRVNENLIEKAKTTALDLEARFRRR